MPRVKRKAKRRREYTANERKLLLDGVSMPTDWGHIIRETFDYAAAEAAWRDLESELLPQWITAHAFTRPLGWLLFDAKQPRERVVGEQLLEALEWTRSHCHSRQHLFLRINRRLGIHDDSHCSEAAFESEKQYLIRLDLLTDAERELL